MQRYKVLQIGLDLVLIFCSFCVAYFARVGLIFSTDFPFEKYWPAAFLVTMLTVFFAILIRTYKEDQKVLAWHHFLRTGFLAIVQVALFTIVYYFFYKTIFSRLILVYIAIFSLGFVYGGHLLYDQWVRSLYAQGKGGVLRTLLIGTNREAQKLIQFLRANRSRHYVVAILDGYGSPLKEIEGVAVKGKLDKLETVVSSDKIDQIIQVDNLEQVLNLLNFAKANGLKYMIAPSVFGAYHKNLKSVHLEGSMPVLMVE